MIALDLRWVYCDWRQESTATGRFSVSWGKQQLLLCPWLLWVLNPKRNYSGNHIPVSRARGKGSREHLNKHKSRTGYFHQHSSSKRRTIPLIALQECWRLAAALLGGFSRERRSRRKGRSPVRAGIWNEWLVIMTQWGCSCLPTPLACGCHIYVCRFSALVCLRWISSYGFLL